MDNKNSFSQGIVQMSFSVCFVHMCRPRDNEAGQDNVLY